LDTGSQRSYISSNILSKLDISFSELPQLSIKLNTFNGSATKIMSEIPISLSFHSQQFDINFLVEPNFAINMHLPLLSQAISNLKGNNYHLADDFLQHSDSISLYCLLGVDFIQQLKLFEIIKCLHGRAFNTNKGIIPFGTVSDFINKNPTESTPDNILSTQLNNIVSNIIEPIHSYFTPLSEPNDCDSYIESGLEQMFNLESIGIHTDNDNSTTIDQQMATQFLSTLTLHNHKYFIEIPWKDSISRVPPNSHVALAVLNRVHKKLLSNNQLSEYDNIFHTQLQNGIIEQIYVKPENYANYVWIPHRAVIKTAAQTTTRIRAVFNCSLKIGDTPSLNQATYQGINLISDLVDLLLSFRSNKYIILSDIKQAFLQIKLKLLSDKNKFCFFWYKNGQLVTYRYTTIVFGFATSPYILGQIIKQHAKLFPDDLASYIISNNFYVDNLIFSHNNQEVLANLFHTLNYRMEQGGFQLRSWNTNSPQLKGMLNYYNKSVDHSLDTEKVLGYTYNTVADTLSLSDFSFSNLPPTKRIILSDLSKVFDPLSVKIKPFDNIILEYKVMTS
jgi:hypothetical protein